MKNTWCEAKTDEIQSFYYTYKFQIKSSGLCIIPPQKTLISTRGQKSCYQFLLPAVYSSKRHSWYNKVYNLHQVFLEYFLHISIL